VAIGGVDVILVLISMILEILAAAVWQRRVHGKRGRARLCLPWGNRRLLHVSSRGVLYDQRKRQRKRILLLYVLHLYIISDYTARRHCKMRVSTW
jgi:hypothetical protein